MKEYFQIGKIVRPHGVKGVVRAETYTSNPKRFKVLKELSVDGQVYEAESIAIDSDGYMLIKLKGINTMDNAEKLRGKILYISRNDVELPEGTYFVQDLIGLEVEDADNGTVYGRITDVRNTGANDIYTIKSEEKEFMVPAVPEFIEKTDIEGGKLYIHMIDGLLD